MKVTEKMIAAGVVAFNSVESCTLEVAVELIFGAMLRASDPPPGQTITINIAPPPGMDRKSASQFAAQVSKQIQAAGRFA